MALTCLVTGCSHTGARPTYFPLSPGIAGRGEWRTIGSSVEDRPILAADFCTRPSAGSGADDVRRIYVIAGIHGDERAGGANVDKLHELLAEHADGSGSCVRLVRDANPDGTANGTRRNVRGVDLNRNWPAVSFVPHAARGMEPLSEPESFALHADLTAFDPHLVVVLHAARNGPYVNFDGPARADAHRFARAAATVDPNWHVRADMGYPTPGSLGSWVGVDRGVPILTIEFRRGRSPIEAWPALRAGMGALIGVEDGVPPSDQAETEYRVR